MRSVLMVIVNVLMAKPQQMSLMERNDMIQHLSAAAAHPSLGDSVGEGRQLHRMATMPIPFLKLSTHTIR